MGNVAKYTCLVFSAAVLALVPALTHAKSGGMQHKPNRDFRELIVRGERPEIAACMVATLDYVRQEGKFTAVRWDDDASDRANMRETENNGQLTRSVRFTTQVRARGLSIFFGTWQTAEVSCEQHEEGPTEVRMRVVSH
jgi:hypothetical protein